MIKQTFWFLLLFLTFISCKNNEKTEPIIRKVKTVTVAAYQETSNNFTFPGKIESAQDANLAFRVAGVIESFSGKEGTFVKKGEVIVTMDNRDYQQQFNATQAEYNAIKGEVNRVIELYKKESVSANDYDKAVNGLKQISAKLEVHKNALNDTRLTAPFDGYIQKHLFNTGETVGAGMPVVAFVSSNRLEAVIDIPIENYVMQNEYVAASASTTLFPNDTINLDLIGINPKANLNQLYKTRFAIESNRDVILAPGMNIMVKMEYNEESENWVTFPLSAIVEKEKQSYVWIISDKNETSLREVSILEITKNGKVVVYDGLNAGERIISAGTRSIKEGMLVEPIEEKSETNIGGLL